MQDKLAPPNASLTAIVPLGADVLRLQVEPDDPVLRHYQAGQFLALYLPDGSPRCYSMARPPRCGRALELHVRLHPNGRFSQWLRAAAAAGERTRLRISGPFGDCTWRQEQGCDRVLLLATGTGIAPLNALLEQAMDDDAPDMEITLYWGGRVASDLYLRQHFSALAERLPGFRFVPVLSHGEDGWQGARGHVQDVAASQHPSLQSARVYACGHSAMVEGARALFVASHGLDASRFHADVFEPAADRVPSSIQHRVDTARIAVRVEDADGVATLLMLPAGQSLMRGLQAAGQVRGICGGNTACGSCRVHLPVEWFDRLPPPVRAEARLLAALGDSLPTSRLACRIAADAAIEGLSLLLPTSSI